MDNGVVVGVGNIYANESLFRAGIRPSLPAHRVSRPRLVRLVDDVRNVLTEAIAKGGSTLRDYVDASGEPGYFQLQYFVYGREGEPCRVCGTDDPACAGWAPVPRSTARPASAKRGRLRVTGAGTPGDAVRQAAVTPGGSPHPAAVPPGPEDRRGTTCA